MTIRLLLTLRNRFFHFAVVYIPSLCFSHVIGAAWKNLNQQLIPSYHSDTPPDQSGGFFLHPARLLTFHAERRVEAVCPEAFSATAEVSLCPRVPEVAFARMFRAAL